jgi:flagellar hook assembly protein FlgD
VVDDVANTVTSPGIDSFAIETLAQNTAGADEVAVGTPDVTRLVSAYPNPFTSATRVAFELADRTAVTIGIYDIRGRRVRTLADGVMNGSRHDLIWRGENEAGERLAAGIYFCQMKAGDVVQVQKVVFSK